MPMDDQTQETVRALLDRHPGGYVAEEAGFSMTQTAAGLFRLLCVSVLATDSAPSGTDIEAAQALLRRWDTAQEMAKTDEAQRAQVLSQAGYRHPDEASGELGQATGHVIDRYDGDLGNLRQAAEGDRRLLRALLRKVPGLADEAGYSVFVRDSQAFWPEAGPFLDYHGRRAARRLGLPDEPGELLADVARGREQMLGWLPGALALVDVHDEYRQFAAA